VRVLLVVPRIHGGEFHICPGLGIYVLAALTPPDIDLTVVDENHRRIDFNADYDLVGITAMTPAATRAYAIADRFRRRGTPVVLGGFHPSLMPDEAIAHADAVVIGEAEEVWPRLLADLAANRMQRFYRRDAPPDLAGTPVPRRDLMQRSAYFVPNTVETGRGCPFRCNFCSVTTLFGHRFRFRPVAEVVSEVKSLPGKLMFIVDDNCVGSLAHARELFAGLIPCGKRWVGQASLNLARDTKLLKLAARSGCIGFFVGFESVSERSLKEAGKFHNDVKRYIDDVQRIRDHGIAVHGAFIFGFDGDDEGVFDRTIDFVRRSHVDSASFSTLTPFPGTPVFSRLEAEGRLLTRDWSRYGGAVFQPKLMSVEALKQGCRRAWRECYSLKSVLGRMSGSKRYWHIHAALNFLWALSVVAEDTGQWLRPRARREPLTTPA
jgi:radical SAM superfamily enzyme YgiQ (UPF0313 family)